MENKISMILKEYGLDEKEIKIYIFLVGKNELTAYNIAKEIKIHRSTCYDVLERLIEKGFCSKIEKEKKIFYNALDIGQIITKIKDKENMLLSLIPEFEKIKEKGVSKVRVFESKESQKQFAFNLYNRVVKGEIKELYSISGGPAGVMDVNKKEGKELVGEESFEIFIEKLIRDLKKKKLHKKIEYKGIWNEKFKGTDLVRFFSGWGEDRFFKDLPTNASTIIYGEYIVFSFTMNGNPQAIEIQNKLIANEMKAYFSYLWKIAKK